MKTRLFSRLDIHDWQNIHLVRGDGRWTCWSKIWGCYGQLWTIMLLLGGRPEHPTVQKHRQNFGRHNRELPGTGTMNHGQETSTMVTS